MQTDYEYGLWNNKWDLSSDAWIILIELSNNKLTSTIFKQIKRNENDGQESIDDSKSGMITTEMPSVPLVPIQPQVITIILSYL